MSRSHVIPQVIMFNFRKSTLEVALHPYSPPSISCLVFKDRRLLESRMQLEYWSLSIRACGVLFNSVGKLIQYEYFSIRQLNYLVHCNQS